MGDSSYVAVKAVHFDVAEDDEGFVVHADDDVGAADD